MAALTLVDLKPRLLEPVALRIDAGELVFISGASGTGKSLLLRAIADLDPNEGEALIGEQPRSELAAPDWRRRVGLLPAETGWWADRVGAHFIPADEARGPASALEPMLARLGFEHDVLEWDVQRLSSGERQRLGLARLLLNGPEVLLLDEATANLDPTNRDAAEALIDDYRGEHRAAVVWASHDLEQRRRLTAASGGRRLVLEQGKLRPEADDEDAAH
jgi:ABC-type iron transport system FetAB ATPase subunit